MNAGRVRRAAWIVASIGCAGAAIGLPTVRRNPPAPLPVVASIRAEPRSFNRYIGRDLSTAVVSYLTQATLVRIDRTSDRLEPDLATSWELLPDQRTYRVHLRAGLKFSDGAPFTADDVVFSVGAIYDPRAQTTIADSMLVAGQPLVASAEDAVTVTIRFPSPYGPGLRVFDGVPILPRHRLRAALEAGKFATAWSPATPPSEIAGLGPFRLVAHRPGQRLTFERNSHYWQPADSSKASRIELEIVPDQEAESLRLVNGAIDFTESEVRASDYALVQRAAAAGRLVLADLGVGLDGDLFWVNLSANPSDPRAEWLQSVEFRRAVSFAIDRDAFVRSVYLGAAVPAYTLISTGNRAWYVDAPAPGFDRAESERRLTRLGLVDSTGDGVRKDGHGRPARFTMITQSGNTSLERGAAFIREALEHVGIQVDVVALDPGALVERIMARNYDSAYFRLITTDTDPSLNADFWLSNGTAHVWNPGQREPATSWEREIDALIDRMSTTLDTSQRRDLFAQVQHIVAREVPALCFAYPRLSFAMSTRITGAMPAAFRPPVLWNAAAIGVNR